MFTRKKILAAVSKAGYSGADDLAALKSWISENNIVLSGVSDDDLNRAFQKTVTISVSADAGEDVQVLNGDDNGMDPEADPEADPELAPKSYADRVRREQAAKSGSGFAKIGGANSGTDNRQAWTPGMQKRLMQRRLYNSRVKSGGALHESADHAEAFGAWFRTNLCDINSKARARMSAEQKAYDEAVLKGLNGTGITTGQALVPDEFIPTLIVNKDRFGALRKIINPFPMSSPVCQIPRLDTDVTISGLAQGGTISDQSRPTTGLNQAVAQKIGGLVKIPNELLADSPISVIDMVTESFSRALAGEEDRVGFTGTGISTDYGIVGITSKLLSLNATIANIAGLTVASGNLFSEFVLGDFSDVVAKLPEYADSEGKTFWLVNRYFRHTVMGRLQYGGGAVPASATGGGNTVQTLGGGLGDSFLGYPVVTSPKMPKADANSQVAALFGDFSRGVFFGEVAGSMSMEISDQRYFDTDEIAIRATERVAIVVHDVGNASATASSREPGPIVGLISAAS